MLRVHKCAACGFPVSEGRTLCLDCEQDAGKNGEKNERESQPVGSADLPSESAASSAAPIAEEFVPAFLADSVATKEPWLANHINLLAIVVLILGIVVAIVVLK